MNPTCYSIDIRPCEGGYVATVAVHGCGRRVRLFMGYNFPKNATIHPTVEAAARASAESVPDVLAAVRAEIESEVGV